VPQPRDANAVTDGEAVCARSEPNNLADHLMPWNHAPVPGRKLTLSEVQVGTAYPADADPDEHLAVLRDRHGKLDQGKRGLAGRGMAEGTGV
jgi:hypothetical protein